MNLYVFDHRGEVEAQKIVNLLGALQSEKILARVSDDRYVVPDAYPSIIFIHAEEPDRMRLESGLTTGAEPRNWALIHYSVGAANVMRDAAHPKIFNKVLSADDIERISAAWLTRLIDTTQAGAPDFTGVREEFPEALIAAYLMEKAGMSVDKCPGLLEAAAKVTGGQSYTVALDAYFKRQEVR